ncbi:MAG: 2-aminoadipate transaminase [Solirubrobacteraceae bacterium]|nr:2-aminoadipate transaminase [Solirubrobacteraceae bacterium]
MDEQDITRTIQELERKLAEFERTLRTMATPSPAGASSAAGEEAAAPYAATPGSVAAPPEPATQPPPPPQPEDEPPPVRSGFGRIVDESVEPPVPHDEAAAPSPRGDATPIPGAPTPPLAAGPAPDLAGPPLGAPEPPPPARTPPPVHEPAPRPRTLAAQRPSGPGPAELLHFRERLERAARDLTHDYDELLGRLSYAAMPTTTGPPISFARGAPSLDIIDVEGLKEAAARAFETDPAGTTAYGTSIGYPRLRSWIADRHGVEPARVLVTNGSMQADAFLFESLVSAGDEVVVERPSYDRTLLSLRGRGAQLHAVELQPDGIDTDALATLLHGGARPKLAHIIPNFQNPAGYTLSLPKRQRLLALAAEHGFVVFEDDPYVALRFSGESLPTMLSMDSERVVYASSFSKTVCPGIRVGYLVGPTELIARIAKLATNTYISPNMVAQSIVYEFCASGAIDRSIETVKQALAERAATLARSLRSELPEAAFVEPQGGYFMWVTLPEGTEVHRLFDAAAERGVAFVKGTDFLLEGGENTLRLAYSGVTPEQIEEGVARLADAYRSL